MGSYAILAIENFHSQYYTKAYEYLKKCYDQDIDVCRFATGMFVLFNGRKKTQKALNKTCKELVVYLNQGTVNIYTKHILRKAKEAYRNREYEASLLNLVKAYSLGSTHSLDAINVLIDKNKLGNMSLRFPKDTT